jgi:hypothetical protein
MRSKPIIDPINSLLAIHYNFTHAELDFIINYDTRLAPRCRYRPCSVNRNKKASKPFRLQGLEWSG